MGLIAILNACHDALRGGFTQRRERLDWRDLAAMMWLALMLPVFVWTGVALLLVGAVLGSFLVTLSAARRLRHRTAPRRG